MMVSGDALVQLVGRNTWTKVQVLGYGRSPRFLITTAGALEPTSGHFATHQEHGSILVLFMSRELHLYREFFTGGIYRVQRTPAIRAKRSKRKEPNGNSSSATST